MSRLFAFGCSFTNYRWSTWADILGAHYDEYQNWGQGGAGNHYIFNSVMEADQRNKFGAGDTVIVSWTNVMREDHYTTKWQTYGNMYTTELYNQKFVKEKVSERGHLIRDAAYIKAVKVLLKSTQATWYFTSMDQIAWQMDQWDPEKKSFSPDVVDLYSDVFEGWLPSFREVLFPDGWAQREDGHPTPTEHLVWLDTVLPGSVTKQEVRVKIAQESEHLVKTKTSDCVLKRL
jgi:hypothetical protein